MAKTRKFPIWIALLSLVPSLFGGVSKEIQAVYVQRYENKAMFLKVPVHGLRQIVFVRSGEPVLDRSNLGQPLAFKVGDQVRITDVQFRDELIRFKISAIDMSRDSELVFQFSQELTSGFDQRDAFDRALDKTLTEGLSYRDIDSAKESFIAGQYDQLIRQFAANTGTSTDYVVQTITEQNPEFQRMRQELAQKQQQLKSLEDRVSKAENASSQATEEATRLRRAVSQAEREADSLKEERSELSAQVGRLSEELNKAKKENANWTARERDYQRQLSEVVRNLDTQTSQSAQLGSQVDSLGQAIDALKRERDNFRGQAADHLAKSEELTAKLEDSEKRLTRMTADRDRQASRLRALTTDKNNLNSRFLQMLEEKEQLETARELEASLRVEEREFEQDRQRSRIFLGTHPIGSLEISPPLTEGDKASVRFEMDSPDTVKFSEVERKLYDSLGEKPRMAAVWTLDEEVEGLELALIQGEAEQEVAPRETAEWAWEVRGTPPAATPVKLSVQLIDGNDHRVLVASREYRLRPGGIGGLINRSFSLWAVLLGFLGGAGLVAAAVVLRRGKRVEDPSPRPAGPRLYVEEKKL